MNNNLLGDTSEIIPCPVCNSIDYKPLFYIAPRQIVECKKCKHEYVNPIDLSLRRREYYFGKAEEKEIHTEIDLHYLMKVFKNYKLPGCNLLDLGCGQGRLEHGLIEAGWPENKLYMMDLSEPALKYARKRFKNINIVCGKAEEKIPFNSFFDCIVMVELMEDVTRPRQVMQNALNALMPGGFLIIRGMPNNYSLQAFLAKEDWKMRIIDVHYNFFNPHIFARFVETFPDIKLLEYGCFLQSGYSFYNISRVAHDLGIVDRNSTNKKQIDEIVRLILKKLKDPEVAGYPLKHKLPINKIINLVSKEDIEEFFNTINLDYLLSPDFSVVLRKEN